MKSFMKAYVLLALFLMAITTQVSAQTRRGTSTNNKTVKRTSISKANKSSISRRVPSTKVIYKTPKRKVIAVRNVPNRTIINYKNQNYYYANNKFYTRSRGSYIVIAPKIGFRINVLPSNYKRIRYNNHNYYNAYGIFYIQINNEYEVVDPEIGTVVYELPDNYEKVVIDGQTYYEYANILYEKVQIDGTRAYEVIGIIDMK
ncbi:DUF6515 family protein [Lutibacter citreus]|uniref:DUF6515 family protein n=1 Tax=Lutibacter citreus TaxID=2138210 RepID=UPI000DBE3D85|nr:DUF6515 family protein [Lutibacter citreus]